MTKKSWRSVLQIHPAADLFPRMSEAELVALGTDIRKHGLTSPVVLWSSPDGQLQLLDGRNRLDAMGSTAEDWSGKARDWKASGNVVVLDHLVDPFAYVVSANIHRRHLTAEQRIELAEKLIKANPTMSARRVAKLANVSPTTAIKSKTKLEKSGDVSTVDTSIDTKGRHQPARKTTTKPTTTSAPKSKSETVRDDIGPASNSEIERIRARNEELETENARLRRAAKPAPESKSASRCSICREKKRAALARVFVCDLCAEIHELKTAADTAPPAGDGLDIPGFLRRSVRS